MMKTLTVWVLADLAVSGPSNLEHNLLPDMYMSLQQPCMICYLFTVNVAPPKSVIALYAMAPLWWKILLRLDKHASRNDSHLKKETLHDMKSRPHELWSKAMIVNHSNWRSLNHLQIPKFRYLHLSPHSILWVLLSLDGIRRILRGSGSDVTSRTTTTYPRMLHLNWPSVSSKFKRRHLHIHQ